MMFTADPLIRNSVPLMKIIYMRLRHVAINECCNIYFNPRSHTGSDSKSAQIPKKTIYRFTKFLLEKENKQPNYVFSKLSKVKNILRRWREPSRNFWFAWGSRLKSPSLFQANEAVHRHQFGNRYWPFSVWHAKGMKLDRLRRKR